MPPELRRIIAEEVTASTLGMARWQARGPLIRDEDDLDDYMFEVAGRVGHMLTRIFAWYARPIARIRDDLMPLAREFGLALQTVNIVRNMREDFERGWIFAPESFCERAGLSRQDLFRPEMTDKALAVVDMLADKAERHSRKGLDYIKLIPGRFRRIRLFCTWPLFFAMRTLALSRGNTDVLEREAKISRDEVWRIIDETRRRVESNDWLEDYYAKLA
jgi:farnesyl-diphosphate farnesyltransferase